MLKIIKSINNIRFNEEDDAAYAMCIANKESAVEAANTRITTATEKIGQLETLQTQLTNAQTEANNMIGYISDATESVNSAGTIAGKTLDTDGSLGMCAQCYTDLASTYGNLLSDCEADLKTWNTELTNAKQALKEAEAITC